MDIQSCVAVFIIQVKLLENFLAEIQNFLESEKKWLNLNKEEKKKTKIKKRILVRKSKTKSLDKTLGMYTI